VSKHVARPFNLLYMDMETVYSCGGMKPGALR
jgi:hypothetical protein